MPLGWTRLRLKEMHLRVLFVWVAVIAVGQANADLVDLVRSAKNIAVIATIDSRLQGQRVGLTVFQNRAWQAPDAAVDANSTALEVLKAALKRDAKLVEGRDAKVFAPADASSSSDEELITRLAQLSASWDTDAILLLQSSTARDELGQTNQRLVGLGVYDRGPNRLAYCVLALRIFDRKAGRIVANENVRSRAVVAHRLLARSLGPIPRPPATNCAPVSHPGRQRRSERAIF